ncbi:MAG: TRAP transporter large permease subunit [Pseudomonadota bacterium]
MIDSGGMLALVMFGCLCAAIMAGYPVAFTLAGVALLFAGIAAILASAGLIDVFIDPTFVTLLPERIFGLIKNEVLLAVPMFILMGVLLERSRVAEDLLESMGKLFGKTRGGLGLSVILVGALLAASTGIVGATVVTMGLLSLPTMLARGYDTRLATGTIAASGTLGQIIPPSIVLVLLGDVMGNAYQEAQQAQGLFAFAPLSVGHLFAGALLPGLGLVALYMLYVAVIAWLSPERAPALVDDGPREDGLALKAVKAMIPPIVLILAVLGSILTGLATPTEAAAIGAVGALLLGGLRCCDGRGKGLIIAALVSLAVLIILALSGTVFEAVKQGGSAAAIAKYGAIALIVITSLGIVASLKELWTGRVLAPALESTMEVTTMVYTIFIGAALFSLVFRGLGGDETVHQLLTDLPGGTLGAMLAVMALMFFLGFFLDFIEIVFVVVPIVAPTLLILGVDPVWLAVMIAINLQTSFLTPPFGFALFYLRSVCPEGVKTSDIYRGALPYVAIQIAALILLALVPSVATWLPSVVFG